MRSDFFELEVERLADFLMNKLLLRIEVHASVLSSHVPMVGWDKSINILIWQFLKEQHFADFAYSSPFPLLISHYFLAKVLCVNVLDKETKLISLNCN